MVCHEDEYGISMVVEGYGTHSNPHYGSSRSEVVMNQNRLLVTMHDSHITEERRIEEKLLEIDYKMEDEFENLSGYHNQMRWNDVIITTRIIQQLASDCFVLSRRLEDVKQINATFSRIQVHIDRIEATEK